MNITKTIDPNPNNISINISDDNITAYFSFTKSEEYGNFYSFDDFELNGKSVYKYDWAITINNLDSNSISKTIEESTTFTDLNKIKEISLEISEYFKQSNQPAVRNKLK